MCGVGTETLDDGDAESEGLAGTGLGLPDDVLTGESEGNRLFLNGEGIDDALGRENIHDVLIDAEFGEGRHDKCLSGGEKPPGGEKVHASSLSHRRGGPDPSPGHSLGYRPRRGGAHGRSLVAW